MVAGGLLVRVPGSARGSIPICSLEIPLLPGTNPPWSIGLAQGETYQLKFNACAHPIPSMPNHS